MQGIDYSFGRPAPSAIVSAGYRFVCRYHSYNTRGKNLTADEAAALSRAGLLIVSNWEWYADLRHDPEWSMYGPYELGRRHAAAAAAQHRVCGGPPDSPIYFSVDFDVPDYAPAVPNTPANAGAKLGGIANYFNGIRAVIGPARVGAYGGYWVVRRLFDAGLIAWGWQTRAWSGGQVDARAHLYQVHNGVRLAGSDVDVNEARQAAFGGWTIGQAPPPAPAPHPAPPPASGHWVTVHRGDTLSHIAATGGLGAGNWRRIWDHPQNRDVRGKRRIPEHIQPGDRFWVPT